MNEGNLIEAVWTGEAFEPFGNWSTAQCHDRLGAGQVVYLDIDPARTKRSHNHQFAFVKTALENLPESLAHMPYATNTETLRKHALIATGYCDTSMLAVGCPRRALRTVAFVNKMAHAQHGYSLTQAEGSVVYCHTAHSQKVKAMGKERFQESKQAILEWLADLIGVKPEELAKMGKRGTA